MPRQVVAEQLLAKSFQEQMRPHDGVNLYPIDVIADLAAFCEQEGIAILGMDGFLVRDEILEWPTEFSADFSLGTRLPTDTTQWTEWVHSSAEQARDAALIWQQKRKDVLIELVVETWDDHIKQPWRRLGVSAK